MALAPLPMSTCRRRAGAEPMRGWYRIRRLGAGDAQRGGAGKPLGSRSEASCDCALDR